MSLVNKSNKLHNFNFDLFNFLLKFCCVLKLRNQFNHKARVDHANFEVGNMLSI